MLTYIPHPFQGVWGAEPSHGDAVRGGAAGRYVLCKIVQPCPQTPRTSRGMISCDTIVAIPGFANRFA
jgi:hypothetical protein